jgi:hypothetical protein
MQFIIMQFSPLSVFLPFTFKYPQHSDKTPPVSTPSLPKTVQWDTIYTHLPFLSLL